MSDSSHSPVNHTIWRGLLFGLLIGHMDILWRFTQGRAEWFEYYQALLVPSAVGVVISLLATLIASVIPSRFSDSTGRVSDLIFHALVSFLLLHLFIVINALGYDTVREPRAFVATLIVLLVLVVLVVTLWKIFARFPFFRLDHLPAQSVISSYCFGCVVFVVSLLFYDLWTQGVRVHGTESSEASGPNVVLITMDTVRPDFLTPYTPHELTTPHLEQLAKESLLFENAASVSSWTLPAHASLFTGQFIHQHGAHARHQFLNFEADTLAEVFQRAGYATAGFVGGPFCKAKYGLAQGFDYYHDRLDFFETRHTTATFSFLQSVLFFLGPDLPSIFRMDGERIADEINQDVKAWIKDLRRPFFLFINYFDAHDPYSLGANYRKRFTGIKRDPELINLKVRMLYENTRKRYLDKSDLFDEETQEYIRALYKAELYYLDEQMSHLFGALRELGHWDNTILIVTSDHGEEFFEHGGILHAQTLYEESIRVPLLIRDPNLLEAKRISDRVSLVDLYSTTLSLAGIEASTPQESADLTQLAPTEEIPKRVLYYERLGRDGYPEATVQATSTEGHKLIQSLPEVERIPNALFDIASDPREHKNLLAEDLPIETLLRNELQEHLQRDSGP